MLTKLRGINDIHTVVQLSLISISKAFLSWKLKFCTL